jgi:hypothetical protein
MTLGGDDGRYSFRECSYPDFWRFVTGPLSSPEILRFLDSGGIDVEAELVTREKGRDLVSCWLSFFRLFSIAFFTARLPPSAAIASYRALRRSFFFSAIGNNGVF